MHSAQQVKVLIAEFVKRDVSSLGDELVLRDLVMDSFRLVELVMVLQERLDVIVNQEDLGHVRTVGDLTAVFASR
jgi:acyl carrier protein